MFINCKVDLLHNQLFSFYWTEILPIGHKEPAEQSHCTGLQVRQLNCHQYQEKQGSLTNSTWRSVYKRIFSSCASEHRKNLWNFPGIPTFYFTSEMNGGLSNVLDCKYWEGRFCYLPGRASAGFPHVITPVCCGSSQKSKSELKSQTCLQAPMRAEDSVIQFSLLTQGKLTYLSISLIRSGNYSPTAGHNKVEFINPFGQLARGTFLPRCFRHFIIWFLYHPFLVLLTMLLEQCPTIWFQP